MKRHGRKESRRIYLGKGKLKPDSPLSKTDTLQGRPVRRRLARQPYILGGVSAESPAIPGHWREG
jgi:hypothetical protein